MVWYQYQKYVKLLLINDLFNKQRIIKICLQLRKILRNIHKQNRSKWDTSEGDASFFGKNIVFYVYEVVYKYY